MGLIQIMNKKVAFIINPKAGVKKNIDLSEFIIKHFPKNIPYDIIVWENKDDFDSIKQRVLNNHFTIAVACGGDGTVNQVASSVKHTSIALGILPLGSGNGLARSLGIPMDLKQALKAIEKASVKLIDGGEINGHSFFCTAGIGFDAHIAEKFAASTTRGFWTYFKTTFKEYFNYKPNTYQIEIDGKTHQIQAFLITIANAGQWGNDVYIAPFADMQDELFHISILKPFPKYSILGVGIKILNKNIHQSPRFQSLEGKHIKISYQGTLPVHFDGEPTTFSNQIEITMQPGSLKVVC